MKATATDRMRLGYIAIAGVSNLVWKWLTRLALALSEQMAPPVYAATMETPANGNLSVERFSILVCPLDKGALELVDNGRFLLNPRNGYRYPIRDGIPVMLVEEGKANRIPVSSRNGSHDR